MQAQVLEIVACVYYYREAASTEDGSETQYELRPADPATQREYPTPRWQRHGG